MTLYKSCGVLGFFKPPATEEDWKDSGYEPDRFVTSCGFLGLQPKKATLYAIPEAWRDACTPLSRAKNATYAVTSPGDCAIQSCAAGTFKAAGRCVAPGTSCVPSAPQPHRPLRDAHPATTTKTPVRAARGRAGERASKRGNSRVGDARAGGGRAGVSEPSRSSPSAPSLGGQRGRWRRVRLRSAMR